MDQINGHDKDYVNNFKIESICNRSQPEQDIEIQVHNHARHGKYLHATTETTWAPLLI